ncbi:MAG: helix-turn-helix transcriptional regulator [Oscillospiraceae bacterium]|nr:helix-turn-helix transcriptional regulator [Oscillospiraceae bacterium]
MRPRADLKYVKPSKSWQAAMKGINEFFSLPELVLDDEKRARVSKVRDEKLIPIIRTVVYMNKNFSKKIHCEDLLKISQMCRTDFYTLIKKTVGEKYSIYLQKIRVFRAHRALGFTDYSFSYIADMCGFGSVTYFGKCYKKYRGYTPKEERAALNELRERYSGIRISHEFFEPEEMKNSQKPLDKPR